MALMTLRRVGHCVVCNIVTKLCFDFKASLRKIRGFRVSAAVSHVARGKFGNGSIGKVMTLDDFRRQSEMGNAEDPYKDQITFPILSNYIMLEKAV